VNYQRLYEYRFQGIDQAGRQAVWGPIAQYPYEEMGRPQVVLDPAAGRCEFINAIPSPERWIVDEVNYAESFRQSDVKVIISDIFKAELRPQYFDGIFASNFLEHLATQEQVALFLEKMYSHLKPEGRIAIMGPNFKYCASEYFDCADHTLALTHIAVAEHLYAAGFKIEKIVPRFLPFSFRGILPPSPLLTSLYLKLPVAWPILGKQFLLIASK
jgi:SAM-dependent methyltransferase